MSPNDIIDNYEHKTPSLEKRIKAIKLLQISGWKVGLRFDPVIFSENYREIYKKFFLGVAF